MHLLPISKYTHVVITNEHSSAYEQLAYEYMYSLTISMCTQLPINN